MQQEISIKERLKLLPMLPGCYLMYDKNNTIIFLYATNKEDQYSFIEAAKSKGYDVLLLDSAFEAHFINQQEQKNTEVRFMRVDSDTLDKLIRKEDAPKSAYTDEEKKDKLKDLFIFMPFGKPSISNPTFGS